MSESRKQIAEREVALSRCGPVNADGVAAVVIDVLIKRFEAALEDRDERAAKIADDHRDTQYRFERAATTRRDRVLAAGKATTAKSIAVAIRDNTDTDEEPK